MRYVEFEHAHRRKHFELFNAMDQPHFNVCAPIDIGALRLGLVANQLPFTATLVYLVSRTANEIPEFRRRIRAGKVVEHDCVHPSITVPTAFDVFGFCEVRYCDDFREFIANAASRMAEMAQNPSMEDDPHRDDYLFLSSFPWVSFTSISHAMHYSPSDSVPRITWGKYSESNGSIQMPLAVQAHHAIVDGSHVGKYFLRIQELANGIEKLL